MIREYAELGFPFTIREIRSLAYEYADEHDLEDFSEEKEMAGRKWWEKYKLRFPWIQNKTAQNLSVARAMGSNPISIGEWFDQYKDLLKKLGLEDKPGNIWNVDESGLEDLPHLKKAVGIKGQDLYHLVAGEKGKRSTVVLLVNGEGGHIPPMIIHKGKRFNPEWRQNKYPGIEVTNSEKGHINKELFMSVGQKLIWRLNVTKKLGENQLLLMDSHHAHKFNYNFMQMMKEYKVTVLAFPAHTTHLLQPLDKAPFKRLEDWWDVYLRKYNREHGAKALPRTEFFSVFNNAYLKAITPNIILAGYKQTGIYPVDPTKVPAYKMKPSQVTDKCKGFNRTVVRLL